MEMKEFVSNFAAQFDETEESVFTPETRFREIEEWSSLVALSVIAMVDEEYDVTLKGDNIKNSETIADIYNAVASKL
jgi:acyl carrier protein